MPSNRLLMLTSCCGSARFFMTLLLFFCLLVGQSHSLSAQPDAKELEKYTKAKARGDEKNAAKAAFEIGKKARSKKDYKTAETYYQNAIRSGLVAENYRLVAQAYSDLGGIANSQNQGKTALDYYQKAADLYFTKLNDKSAYGEEKFRAGLVFKGMRSYTKAIEFFKQASNLAAESGNAALTQRATEQLSLVYRELGDTQRANMYQELYAKLLKPAEKVTVLEKEATALANLGDSLSLTRQELDMQRQKMEDLEEEKRRKSKEIMELVSANEAKTDSLLKASQELEATLEAQKIKDQRNLFVLIAGIVFVVLVSISFVVVLNAYRAKNKANQILAQKNEEIESQKAIIEEEKEKSEKLLLNILPKETATELMEKGYATPRQYDMVTVLFTDFKGFTNIAEQLTPAEIIKDLDDCFFAFDEICEKYNLEKIKTIGDAYMCAAGLPLPNTTNPRDAVLAGLEMQAFMEQWKEKKVAQGRHYFELRLGIHTGAVVAGVVGKKKFAYDIWGDAVNTAARMESSGEVGRVNISGATYQYIKDEFFCSYRGKVPAKNKGEVDMYFVISKY